jgi:hypothetical protein
MNSKVSLYIPSVKISYTEDNIKYIFNKFGLGQIKRIDFVPIMKTNKDNDEVVACNKFKQAFLYINPREEIVWDSKLVNAIEENRAYKLYINHYECYKDQKEYWLILKNKSPVPYATTELNIHQLAHNNLLLEARILELEEELKKLKEEKVINLENK